MSRSGGGRIESPDAEVMKHTHLIADLDDGRQLRFRDPRRFGGIWWLGQPSFNGDEATALGPEPLLVRRLLRLRLAAHGGHEQRGDDGRDGSEQTHRVQLFSFG